MTSVASAFSEHIDELERRAMAGDDFATRSLCAMVLLKEGWRPGDPDPEDDGGPGDGEEVENHNIIDLVARLAA
jgi:hypothetical protein